ncbi:hypothetical protein N7474_010776 [Penicillium riverlandense]|uniref:uncharacterized protein n=1 Tax=Penicillium riverlandense TaxID=1903569 RepID=UPI002546A163|nr:uncharacterized protein N7474_010776 [Penicillium riverlandense]KAJ5804889.1 hypothetical protein N7474_010776 [Penicillium riverlandense]
MDGPLFLGANETTDHSEQELPKVAASTNSLALPCAHCRRRKVRCSRTYPCVRCKQRNEQCWFDIPANEASQTHEGSSSEIQPNERAPKRARTFSTTIISSSSSSHRYVFSDTEKEASAMLASTGTSPLLDTRHSHFGKLVHERNQSRYLVPGFWPTMYFEIGNLSFLLDHDQIRKHSAGTEPTLNSESEYLYRSINMANHPSPSAVDYLINTYIQFVDPFLRILHVPQMLRELNLFRRGVLVGAPQFECRVFVVYSLATLSLTDEECRIHLGEAKNALQTRFKTCATQGLEGLSLHTTHEESALQTYLMYITLLFWSGEMLEAGSMLAIAARMAQRIGVHRDGELFGLSPWKVESRRRLWYHILLLDTWVTDNCGLDSLVSPWRVDDIPPPLNCNDRDWDVAEFSTAKPSPRHGYTDMSLALLQYEIAAISHTVLRYLPLEREDDHNIYYSFLEQFLEHRQKYLQAKFLDHLDTAVPRQKLMIDLVNLALQRFRLVGLQASFQVVEASSLSLSSNVTECELE